MFSVLDHFDDLAPPHYVLCLALFESSEFDAEVIRLWMIQTGGDNLARIVSTGSQWRDLPNSEIGVPAKSAR
jgi:hypothetical protein